MKIKVLFFGMLAEATETPVLEIESGAVKLCDLERSLKNRFPVLEQMTFKIAVNEKLAETGMVISAPDRVAFLPPFAGG